MRSKLFFAGVVAALTGFSLPFPSPESAAPAVAIAAVAAPMKAAAPASAAAAPAAAALSGKAALIADALDAFSSETKRMSDRSALRTAFTAYFNYRDAHRDDVTKPYLYFVDYGLDNRTPRGWVFDMDKLTVVDGPFTVAHGRGSSKVKNAVPTRFSNRSGAATTSLGLYRAAETYGFSGHSGGVLYTSIGLRLDGVSGSFNSAARARGVVAHGAPYVTPSGSGRSEGCPAMEQARARRLLPMLSNGAMVFLYSPNDSTWLAQDPWVNADDTTTLQLAGAVLGTTR